MASSWFRTIPDCEDPCREGNASPPRCKRSLLKSTGQSRLLYRSKTDGWLYQLTCHPAKGVGLHRDAAPLIDLLIDSLKSRRRVQNMLGPVGIEMIVLLRIPVLNRPSRTLCPRLSFAAKQLRRQFLADTAARRRQAPSIPG